MEKTALIGQYVIEEELAQSNTCSVFRATEESLQRPVLIKKLHPQMAREEDIRSRFEREAQVCAHVNHENIVSIYGYHADPELTMLVLEFVEGRSLGELVAECGRIEWQIVLALLFYVLKGLSFAHGKGVIHRDIKPDNILISHEGQVKITDFGLATIEDAPKLTRQGMVLGTPAYLPPEGLTGSPPDIRSDLFSLGATFYETATGISPFHGDSFSETMNNILKNQPQNPSSLVPDIPREFDQIIMRLIEKNPTQRYATADLALEDVKRVRDQFGVHVDPETIRKYLDALPENDNVRKSKARSKSSLSGIMQRLPASAGSTAGALKVEKPANQLRTAFNSKVFLITLIFLGFTIIAGVNFLPDADVDDFRSGIPVADRLIISALKPKPPGTIPVETAENEDRSTPVKNVPQPAGKQVKPETAREDKPATAEQEPEATSGGQDLAMAGMDIAAKPGRLHLTTKQWAQVTIDNVPYGVTPLAGTIELKPGSHHLVLSNEEFPAPVSIPLIITTDKETRLEVDLMTHFAIVKIRSVKPWAEIFVDQEFKGSTPLSRPIILSFGTHTIELKNPDYRTWRKEFTVNPGDSPVEISVDLETSSSMNQGRE